MICVSLAFILLQQRRSYSGIFAGKYGLITLRDLFRWAERYRKSPDCKEFYDWEQQLAEDGELHRRNILVFALHLYMCVCVNICLDMLTKQVAYIYRLYAAWWKVEESFRRAHYFGSNPETFQAHHHSIKIVW